MEVLSRSMVNGTSFIIDLLIRHSFARQACVEELVMLPDGRFQQAEMTSQGFNGAPLEKGTYPASIACILHGKLEPEISRPDSNAQPYVTQDAPG